MIVIINPPVPGNTTHYTLHTTHYTLHTTHYTLHTTHYTLHRQLFPVAHRCVALAANATVTDEAVFRCSKSVDTSLAHSLFTRELITAALNKVVLFTKTFSFTICIRPHSPGKTRQRQAISSLSTAGRRLVVWLR